MRKSSIFLERDGDRVRLITRGGYDWTKRYPWIVESALKNRVRQFVIDGEAVVLGIRYVCQGLPKKRGAVSQVNLMLLSKL